MTFEQIIAANYTDGEVIAAFAREASAFITDAVDSIANYVASIGDARINGGWNFS